MNCTRWALWVLLAFAGDVVVVPAQVVAPPVAPAPETIATPAPATTSPAPRRPCPAVPPAMAAVPGWRGPVSPAAPYGVRGVDSACAGPCDEATWKQFAPLTFQQFAQGEYAGHARAAHVPEYRVRVDDHLEFVYRLTRLETTKPYELNVGDSVRIESVADPLLDRELIVQPDGTITLKLLGQVRATRRTITELRDEIERLYMRYYREPAVTLTPVKVNTKLDDLRQSVNSQFGTGGQVRRTRVTPEGTVALPVVGSVYVQGLTLEEITEEMAWRYAEEIEGIEVTAVLTDRAPRYVFVLGEVNTPGRFTLEGPTTAMQAIALAGSWRVGANLRQVVIFRRADDWRLMATMLDIRGALYGKQPAPSDELWLNDADVVLVPKAPIKVANDVIEQVFTRGLYGVLPFATSYNFNAAATFR